MCVMCVVCFVGTAAGWGIATLARPATATFGNCALKTSLQLMFGSDSQTVLVFVRQHLRAGERVAQCANVN